MTYPSIDIIDLEIVNISNMSFDNQFAKMLGALSIIIGKAILIEDNQFNDNFLID